MGRCLGHGVWKRSAWGRKSRQIWKDAKGSGSTAEWAHHRTVCPAAGASSARSDRKASHHPGMKSRLRSRAEPTRPEGRTW